MDTIKKFFSIKSLRILIIVIDSIVPLLIIPSNTDYFYYPKIITIYILLLLSVIITVTSTILGTIKLKFDKSILPVLLFVFMTILSTIFSDYKSQALWGRPGRHEGLLTYLSYFLIFYFSWLCFESEKDIKQLMRSFIPSACIIALYGLLQHMGIDPIPRDAIRSRVDWAHSSFSTLGNPNFLGSYLAMVFPITFTLYISGYYKKFISSTKQIVLILYGLLLLSINIILFTVLILTNTRSAWLGTLLSLIFISVLKFKDFISSILKHKLNKSTSHSSEGFNPLKLVRVLAVISILSLSLAFINYSSGGLIISRFKSIIIDYKTATGLNERSQEEKSSAGSQRIFIWTRSLDYIFDRPLLGSGPDTFDHVFKMSPEEAEYHFESRDIYVDKAHNEYLQILITLGFPALIFYAAFLIIVSYKSVHKHYDKKNTMLGSIVFSGVLSYIIQAFFNISVVSVAPVFWSMLGVANSPFKKTNDKI